MNSTKGIYYRLIALWVLCEAMLGGIIHGFKIPVSGLVVGSCAVICITLIAWYVPGRNNILKATVIVAIFKMMLSPQAPFPAYIAVFFQGLLGELLFFNRKFFRFSCVVFAVLALLESGLQRILVLTIVYGNDLWVVINDFFNSLTRQKNRANYSLLIGSVYVGLHLLTGIIVGRFAALLPQKISKWKNKDWYLPTQGFEENQVLPVSTKKRKRLRAGLFIIWIFLIGLYVQSYYRIGNPILPTHVSLKILLRSIIIILAWVFLVGPLLKQFLFKWLAKKQTRFKEEINSVFQLMPYMQSVLVKSWRIADQQKGWRRPGLFSKIVLTNVLTEQDNRVVILSAPIGSGKTTSLMNWSAGRDDVHGILSPVKNGKRFFFDIETNEEFEMESRDNETDNLSVGRFVFSKKNFDKAATLIRKSIGKQGWIVIDEAGPLELGGEGFHEVISEVIKNHSGKIMIVVRDGLAEKIKNYFNIQHAIVISDLSALKSW